MRSLLAASFATGFSLVSHPTMAQVDDAPKPTDLLAFVVAAESAELVAASEGLERIVLVKREADHPDSASLYVLADPSLYADREVLLHVPGMVYSSTETGPSASLEAVEDGGVIVSTQVAQGTLPWSERITLREVDGVVKVTGYAAKIVYSPTGSQSSCTWDLVSGDWDLTWNDIGEDGQPADSGTANGNRPENLAAADWPAAYPQVPEICVKEGVQTY